MPDITNPFSEDDFDQIEAAIKQATETEEAIKKAKRAGIELPEMLETVRSQRQRLNQIKSTYFPGR